MGSEVEGHRFIESETVAIEYRLMTSLARPSATRTRPKRLAVLVNSANPATAETTAKDVQAAACGIRSQVEVLDASTSREIDGGLRNCFFCEPPNNSS